MENEVNSSSSGIGSGSFKRTTGERAGHENSAEQPSFFPTLPVALERPNDQDQRGEQHQNGDQLGGVVQVKLKAVAVLNGLGELLEGVLLLHLGVENAPQVAYALRRRGGVVGGLEAAVGGDHRGGRANGRE